MKIAMIGPFPPPIHGMSLANKMLFDGLKKVHSVYVMNTDSKRVQEIENLSEQGKISFSKTFSSLAQVITGVCRILFKGKLDAIYITPGQSTAGYLKYTPFMWAARIRKIPYFIHIHGGYFRTMYNGLRGWKKRIIDRNLKELAGAIVLGPSLRFMFKGIVSDEKIFVCENGVEDEIFATEKEIKQKIERYRIDDTIRIIYLSNLMESKGILDLFEAVKVLRKQGKKVHLDVAGAIEPAIEDRVKAFLKELGESVTYYGVVKGKKKKELLLNNYIFCLPSKHPYGEGQPISILEAMANGCVVITTDHGGIRDIVNEEYGVFVEKQNPESIVEVINKHNYNNMMCKSWLQASKKYKFDQFVSRIELTLPVIKDKCK